MYAYETVSPEYGGRRCDLAVRLPNNAEEIKDCGGMQLESLVLVSAAPTIWPRRLRRWCCRYFRQASGATVILPCCQLNPRQICDVPKPQKFSSLGSVLEVSDHPTN